MARGILDPSASTSGVMVGVGVTLGESVLGEMGRRPTTSLPVSPTEASEGVVEISAVATTSGEGALSPASMAAMVSGEISMASRRSRLPITSFCVFSGKFTP